MEIFLNDLMIISHLIHTFTFVLAVTAAAESRVVS